MRTYSVLVQIRGLRRLEVGREREPIAEGEVIALPDDLAAVLASAIELSDDDVTVELDFDPPALPATIASDDVDGLIAAVRNVGGVAKIIAAAGAAELRAALDKIEPPAPPAAPDIGLISNVVLATECAARLADGSMLAEELPVYLMAIDHIARLSVGVVDAGAISAEAAALPDVDLVGVALSALKARGDEITRLQKELAERPLALSAEPPSEPPAAIPAKRGKSKPAA